MKRNICEMGTRRVCPRDRVGAECGVGTNKERTENGYDTLRRDMSPSRVSFDIKIATSPTRPRYRGLLAGKRGGGGMICCAMA